MDSRSLNKYILLKRNEGRRIVSMIDPAWYPFGSYNLPQVLGIKDLVVVLEIVYILWYGLCFLKIDIQFIYTHTHTHHLS